MFECYLINIFYLFSGTVAMVRRLFKLLLPQLLNGQTEYLSDRLDSRIIEKKTGLANLGKLVFF